MKKRGGGLSCSSTSSKNASTAKDVSPIQALSLPPPPIRGEIMIEKSMAKDPVTSVLIGSQSKPPQ